MRAGAYGNAIQRTRVDAAGWLEGARRAPSPHADERPPGAAVSLVVVHGVSLPPGKFGGPWVEDFFRGRLDEAVHPYFQEISGLRVSPHLFIRRNGEIVQFVACQRRAWHAGVSSWHGRENCNDFSIGIELEGGDSIAYADAQYERLAGAIHALRARYPSIGVNGIVGHSDIAPGRKTDPGPAFDWTRLRTELARGRYNFREGSTTRRSGESET